MATRVIKSQAKLKKLRVISNITTKSRRLFRTGVVPQASWGQEAKGLAPTVVRGFRTKSGKGTGARKSGGCLTTSLATAFGPENDPAQTFTISLLTVWCKLWASEPQWQAAIKEVWNRVKTRLQAKHLGRWNGVTGHIGAVIATLLDLGWDPASPATWKDPEGQEWHSTATLPVLKGTFKG